MSEPSRKRARTTPRPSATQDHNSPDNTPFQDLHQLGRMLRKPATPPAGQTSGTGSKPPSRLGTPGSTVSAPAVPATVTTRSRTPGGRTGTGTGTGTGRTRTPVRRGLPTTPHAIRALQQRRTGMTPGRERRRSVKTQRETPRDDLRKLSRVMAKTSQPIAPSPASRHPSSGASTRSRLDQFMRAQSDSPAIGQPPRMSLALHDDDDSFHEAPPRLSAGVLDDETGTVHSIEGGRRALGRNRMDRESFGGMRLSDRFGEVDELEMNDPLRDGLAEGLVEGEWEDEDLSGDLEGGTTRDLRQLLEQSREGQSRTSGDLIQRQSPQSDGDPTFLFTIPDRRRSSIAPRTPQDNDQADVEPGAEVVVEDEDDVAQDDDEYPLDPTLEAIEDDDDDDEHDEQSVVSEAGINAQVALSLKKSKPTTHKEVKVSQYGIEYPSLPTAVLKKLGSRFSKACGGNGKLNSEVVAALSQASDWFFEQMSEDLATYSSHARRKTIEDADVVTLMRRQRLLNNRNSLFSLATKSLPGELVHEIRMPAPAKVKGRKRRLTVIAEEAK